MVFLYSWDHFKADGGMGKINTYVYTTLLKVVFLFFFFSSRRPANHVNAIFKIYPEYISHCLHLGHVTLVTVQDRCRQTSEQSIIIWTCKSGAVKILQWLPITPHFYKTFFSYLLCLSLNHLEMSWGYHDTYPWILQNAFLTIVAFFFIVTIPLSYSRKLLIQ